jgi:hypothetical protein
MNQLPARPATPMTVEDIDRLMAALLDLPRHESYEEAERGFLAGGEWAERSATRRQLYRLLGEASDSPPHRWRFPSQVQLAADLDGLTGRDMLLEATDSGYGRGWVAGALAQLRDRWVEQIAAFEDGREGAGIQSFGPDPDWTVEDAIEVLLEDGEEAEAQALRGPRPAADLEAQARLATVLEDLVPGLAALHTQ